MAENRDSRRPPRRRSPAPYFSSIAVVVSSRKKAVAWYTEKLGLEVIASEGHWITVGRKGHGGVLHLCRSRDYDAKGRLEPGNSGINLRLPGDFEAGCAALKERGVRFSQPPTKEAWGSYAGVVDPDGNEIWLTPEA